MPVGLDIVHLLILVVIIGGAIAVAIIATRVMGWAIPAWFWQICMIIAVVVVAIFAIKLIASLW